MDRTFHGWFISDEKKSEVIRKRCLNCKLNYSTASIQRTMGTAFLSAFSIPIFRVIVELEQEAHEPTKRNLTMPSSMSTSSTLPPSAMSMGRSVSRTSSTSSFMDSTIQ